MNYILKMLSQPSTYAGFAGIAAAAGVAAPEYAAISAALAAVFGVVAFFVDGAPSA